MASAISIQVPRHTSLTFGGVTPLFQPSYVSRHATCAVKCSDVIPASSNPPRSQGMDGVVTTTVHYGANRNSRGKHMAMQARGCANWFQLPLEAICYSPTPRVDTHNKVARARDIDEVLEKRVLGIGPPALYNRLGRWRHKSNSGSSSGSNNGGVVVTVLNKGNTCIHLVMAKHHSCLLR